MPDPTTFEARLAAALDLYAAGAPVAVDAVGVARLAAAAAPVRPTLADRWTAAFGSRRLGLALLLLLLLAAVVGSLIVASQLRDRGPRVYGAFTSTGDLPAAPPGLGEETVVTLADGRVLLVGAAGDAPNDPAAWLYDPTTGRFTATGAPDQLRISATLTTLRDGRVLLVGGFVNVVDGTVGYTTWPTTAELYDPATETFRPAGALAFGRSGHTATLLADGRVLVAGGGGATPDPSAAGATDPPPADPASGSAELYDPVAGTFTATGPLRVPLAGHAAMLLSDGRVLLAGGLAVDPATGVIGGMAGSAAELFDPATGTFAVTGSMNHGRDGLTLTSLADGRVLVVGGGVDGAASATAEVYDPATGTFAATGSLATDRTGAAAVRLPDGRVLVVGGGNDRGGPRTAELYDPTTGLFEPAGRAAGPHDPAVAATLPDGRVLVVGRAAPELWSPLDPLDPPRAAPVARAITTSVAPSSGAPAHRVGESATLLADGRVLIAGGRDVPSAPDVTATILRSAEVYDPTTGRTTPVRDMTMPRADHAAVLLPDGRVLLAGGDDLTSFQEPHILSAELFDPATGTFMAAPGDLGPHLSGLGLPLAAATLLTDGRLLFVVQDVDSDVGRPVAFAHVFDPGSGRVTRPTRIPCPTSSETIVRLADGRILALCSRAGSRDRNPGLPPAEPPGYVLEASGVSGAPLDVAGPWDVALQSQSVLLRDGRVLVIADDGRAGIYDPIAGTFALTGSMSGRRDGGRAALLADGRVLVVGGRRANAEDAQATADVYDPATGTFHLTGPLATARYQPTVTVLADGRVLIVGGVVPSADRTDPAPVEAEILDPHDIP